MTAAAVQTFIYIIVDGVNLLVFGLYYTLTVLYATICIALLEPDPVFPNPNQFFSTLHFQNM